MAPIIIIGAGLVGLTLAQALKKEGFDFRIYDRDNNLDERPAGWGITLHWVLPALESCVPSEVFNRLLSIQVDPINGIKGSSLLATPSLNTNTVEENDCYRFLDLETGKDKHIFPAGTHYRLNRKQFRDLLSTGLDISWGKRFVDFTPTDDGVSVRFDDGETVDGSMLLAVDGSASRVKRLLIGDNKAKMNTLPVAFVGITLRLSPEKMKPYRDIHPVIWQGTHPSSGYYIFFSTLSTPETNGSAGTDDVYYEGQFCMSWLTEKNGPLPESRAEQLAMVKNSALVGTGYFPSLRQAILEIPDDSVLLDIKLQDWPTQAWPSAGGRVALVGDAAHTMTMCRFTCGIGRIG